MNDRAERLYALLPAVYRIRDEEEGSPLRALLAVMEEEHLRIEEDIQALYDSWFVETAPEWVLPYIGDLVGNRLLAEVTHSRRTDVARTLGYRRRKGTLPMLEALARDVTGWGARAVAFMELLGWSQNLNHPRPLAPSTPVDSVGTVHLRNRDLLDRLGGAWDATAHTVDVRTAPGGAWRPGSRSLESRSRARPQEGWYGPRKVGFFLWRLGAFPLEAMPARRADPPNQHGWHFSPLGAPVPLFVRPRPDRDPTQRAEEVNVAAPIRPVAFHGDVEEHRARVLPLPPEERPLSSRWYGPGRSFQMRVDGVPVPAHRLLCKELGGWARPPAGRIAVDVARGRFTFAEGEEPGEVQVDFAYGFSAGMGGGPYDRRATLVQPGSTVWFQSVAKGSEVETLQQALEVWEERGRPHGLIQIDDSGIYGGNVEVDLPPGGSLVIQAAQGRMPSVRLVGDFRVAAPEAGARLVLNGLLVEGALSLAGNPTLELVHCTLVPGRMLTDDGAPWFVDRDSLVVPDEGDPTPQVTIHSSIVGPIRLPATARELVIRDSIVQAFPVGGAPRPAIAATDAGDEPGPATILERSTILASVHVRELTLASQVIFTEPVVTERTQAGCVRFSYLPTGSRTPRRFHCQPDRALEGIGDPAEAERIRARLVPTFTSLRYNHPGYAQLRHDAALEIRTGGEDGAEMGAFRELMQPQREANLRTRLEEYLPFGLEAALIYVT